MEKSTLEKFTDNQLVYLGLKLIKSEFDYRNPYSDFEKDMEMVNRLLKYFQVNPSPLDVEYIAKFIHLNEENFILLEKDNKMNISNMSFKRPKSEEYKVDYEVWGPATFTERYRTKRASYDKAWVRDGIFQDYNDGVWNYFDGDYIEHDVDNWEVDEFRVNYVGKINENNINSLNKNTLLELRNLIDKKLSLL